MGLNILKISMIFLIVSVVSASIDTPVQQETSVSQEDCKTMMSKIIETVHEVISQED